MTPRMGLAHHCALFSFLFAATASAYTPTITANGKNVKWSNGGFKYNLAGNPSNTNGIRSDEFFDAVIKGLQRWETASGGSVDFDYWQGDDPEIYEPNSNQNGLSSIYFASNTRGGPMALSPNVLGLTQVWYNTETGEIIEADIVLNDRNYEFTLDPSDTSGPGAGRTSFNAGKSRVFIGNVISHELGHSFGLSHTGTMQSTMLFMESPEQAYLGCDEMIGIRAIYPAGDAGSRGAISGDVINSEGRPVFGAHVLAISRQRGNLLASSLTDRSGRYSIRALEPGAYYLAVEPFFAGSQALPAYFSRINEHGCSTGLSYGRSFKTDESGYRLVPVEVRPGTTSEAGGIRVNCGPGNGAAISGNGSSARQETAPTIYNGNGGGFGAVDRFQFSPSAYYRLDSLSGRVEIHGISHSLYSPVKVALSLYDAQGNRITTESADRVYEGHSGYVNFDTRLTAHDLAPGTYYLRASSSSLNPVYYPGGQIPLDTVPFVVITGTVNASPPALASSLPLNARCVLDDRPASYASPPGNPPRATPSSDDTVGFCSSIRNNTGDGASSRDSRDTNDFTGPSAPAIVGWFLPYLVVLPLIGTRRGRRLLLGCA